MKLAMKFSHKLIVFLLSSVVGITGMAFGFGVWIILPAIGLWLLGWGSGILAVAVVARLDDRLNG